MPTITFRLSEQERAAVQAAASRSGLSVSDYIRQALELRDDKISERVSALEHQVRALTEAANRGHGYIPDF